jgi:hypothetical protein
MLGVGLAATTGLELGVGLEAKWALGCPWSENKLSLGQRWETQKGAKWGQEVGFARAARWGPGEAHLRVSDWGSVKGLVRARAMESMLVLWWALERAGSTAAEMKKAVQSSLETDAMRAPQLEPSKELWLVSYWEPQMVSKLGSPKVQMTGPQLEPW